MTSSQDQYYILRIPDTGSLHQAVKIIATSGLTVTRCQYNRSIDSVTAFFSVRGPEEACLKAAGILRDEGYLQTTIRYPMSIRFTVFVPEIPGTLDRILTILDHYRTEILSLSFDNRGKSPDQLQIGIRVRDPAKTGELLERIRAQYRVEVVVFDCGEEEADGCLFYLRYAEKVRSIIGETDDPYLLDLLIQFSHIAQQLTEYGKEYEDVLDQILQNGKRLIETSGAGFYADVQKISLPGIDLFCFQPPGGGSIFILDAPDERVMIDTGYGIYHPDTIRMFREYGLSDRFTRIILTHGDTDHCGAAGYYDAPVYTHKGTKKIIETNNRAYGACSQDLVLEQVYTVMINLFARMNPADNMITFPPGTGEMRGVFPVIGSFTLGGKTFEVLEGQGGHQHGMVYVLSRDAGILFTSDTILNLKHLSPDRSDYNGFAVYLVTTVNVDPELVKSERRALLDLARSLDRELQEEGRRLLICCGHGPVSYLEGSDLVPAAPSEPYRPQ